jgi:hypothetical protein
MSDNRIYNNRKQVRKNIRAIRHYLFMSKREFAHFVGLGKRGEELESRLLPTMDEIEKISKAAEVPADRIINGVLYVTLQMA